MEKCLYAFDYVDLKNREYERKHTKIRHLGDVDGKYRFRARSCTPTLVGSLVNLELPESRAINTSTAKGIIANQAKQIQGTYEKSNRTATLDAWSYPPLFEETQQDEVELPRRPHTAAGTYERVQSGRVSQQTIRPFSTGSPGQRTHPNTPPQLQRYMVDKLKRSHSSSGIGRNVALKNVTTSLQAQWEEEDRNEKQSPRRVKSQSAKRFDSFAGQWLSFAGGTEHDDNSGVLDAFTGEAADEYYNVESRIGANIANQLNKGNKIRVGNNGVLQSNSLKVNKWKNEIKDSSNMSDSYSTLETSWDTGKPVRPIVPLSWDDQLTESDATVVDIKDKQHPKPKPDLCERHPVVFHKLVKEDNLPKHKVRLDTGYQVRQRTKNKQNIDGTQSLNNRITKITVEDVKDRDSMCSEDYEELLHRSLQTTDFIQNNNLEFDNKELLDVQSSREELTLSPPAPSLANESQESFVSAVGMDDTENKSTGQTNLTKINLSPNDLIKPEMANRQRSPVSSARQRSAVLSARQSSAASTSQQHENTPPSPRGVPRAGAPIMSARTRSRTPQTDLLPKRAQSSPPRRPKHYFDEPPTHARVKSPRPNLAKPGQLPRKGVASIGFSSQDGAEQEYIKISQQILPTSAQSISRSYSASSRTSDKLDKGSDLPTVFDESSETGSIDSMDVNKGDKDYHHDEHMHEQCTCSPEAKRVLSAALTHLSNTSDPSVVINIPTGGGVELDTQSNHDSADVASLYSDRSDPLAGLDTPLDSGRQSPELNPPNDDDGQVEKPSPNSSKDQIINNTNDVCPSPEEDIFINKTDGLKYDQTNIEQMNHADQPKSRVVSAGKQKRSVKFADEQEGSISVPQCTPSSTPREPNSDSEHG